jgi:hypothetical protein
MNQEPPQVEPRLGDDLKTFEQLPAKTKELEELQDQSQKTTGKENLALQHKIQAKAAQTTKLLSI